MQNASIVAVPLLQECPTGYKFNNQTGERQFMRKLSTIISGLMLLSASAFAQTEVTVTGDITSNVTWTADKSYLLKGFVRVQSGAVVTIEPGTKIYGENATQGSFIVKPGGKVIAEGTEFAPIVFTSEFAKPGSSLAPARGDWGGVILLGNAPINVTGGTASIEGPGDSYGGNDPEDNSGVLKYVRIEYAGIAFTPNNEINGLTFGGVGRGTIIDYVQVSWANDDSFEWFGGNVNAKHLIAYQGLDDDFDTDFGYSGKLQFLLSVRDKDIADVSGSNGFESDNDAAGSVKTPRTSPTWYNVTLIGPKETKSTTVNSNYKRGMHLRRSSQNKIQNALVMGWPTGLLLDGKTTAADAIAGNWWIKNSIIAGSSSKALDTTASNSALNISDWFTVTNGNRVLAENTEVGLVNPFGTSGFNPTPKPGSVVFTGAAVPPADGFFDPSANFVGAFGTKNWAANWSDLNTFIYTDVKNNNGSKAEGFALLQNYPNPFNPSTVITFSVPSQMAVKLTVFNALGQEVGQLVNGQVSAGEHQVSFNAGNLPSGIYFSRMEAGNQISTKKMMLIK